jgi:hypothetical protein
MDRVLIIAGVGSNFRRLYSPLLHPLAPGTPRAVRYAYLICVLVAEKILEVGQRGTSNAIAISRLAIKELGVAGRAAVNSKCERPHSSLRADSLDETVMKSTHAE